MIKPGKISVTTILVALIGVLFCGMGVGINNMASLGNDSVGILYDGFLNTFGLELSTASNVVNISLVVLLLFIGRRYVSLGTIIYLIPYGFCVSAGIAVANVLKFSDALPVSIMLAVLGSLILCMGIALFIVIDIGVDPFTGVVLVLVDKLKKEYKFVKIGFDISCIIIGFLLGGKAGVVTLVLAVLLGPSIQFFVKLFTKLLVKKD